MKYELLHPLGGETDYLFLVCVYKMIGWLGLFGCDYLLNVFISMGFVGS